MSRRMEREDFGAPSASLWLVNGGLMARDDLAFFAAQLGAAQAERYRRFARSERRRQFLIGRTLLKFAMARLTGLPPAEIGFAERPGNAPLLTLPVSSCLRPAFSLSHSGDWIACAVSLDSRLGVDIEIIDPARDMAAIAQSAFTAGEYAWLRRQPDGARVAAFYELWSSREALYKLLLSDGGNGPALPTLVGADGMLAVRGLGWHRYAMPHPGFSCVVCSAQPLSAVRLADSAALTRAAWPA